MLRAPQLERKRNMYYPAPTPEDVLRFEDQGFLVVKDAIDQDEREALLTMGQEMVRRPAKALRIGIGDAVSRSTNAPIGSFRARLTTSFPGSQSPASDPGQRVLVLS